jgi:mono/diheme cytochrome c family protein
MSRIRGAGLYGRAAASRTAAAIYHESDQELSRAHARQSVFETIHVGRGGGARPAYGARSSQLFCDDPAKKAADDGDSDLAARGRTIYLDGIPEANIASCYACHGPNAEGVRDIPRLGGLAYFYLKGRLEQWGQGYHSGVESPMPMVARHLGSNEIEALASYLSFAK